MKKNLWMLGAAIVALTSCTQNEVLDVPKSKLIGFEPFVGKNTRAAIQIQQNQTSDYTGTPPADNLYQFWVFAKMDGTPLFNGTDASAKVYYQNAPTSGFTYDNHKAWTLGKTYSFAAYSNGNHAIFDDTDKDNKVGNGEITKVTHEEIRSTEGIVTGSKLTFTDYTVGDFDLLAAIAKTETLSSEATSVSNVPLTFQHMLSCIHIRLENGSDNLHMQIGNIEFEGIKTSTCIYKIEKKDNNNWEKSINWKTTGNSKENYTFEGTGINDDDNTHKYIAPGGVLNMRYFVIPQSNQDFTNIELDVKSYTKDGNNYTESKKEGSNEKIKLSLAISDNAHKSWQPGYQYNYTGTLSGSAHWIHFTVKPTENWIPSDHSNLIQ